MDASAHLAASITLLAISYPIVILLTSLATIPAFAPSPFMVLVTNFAAFPTLAAGPFVDTDRAFYIHILYISILNLLGHATITDS